jgi:hypothetical protein
MINDIVRSIGFFCLGYSLTSMYGLNGLILAIGVICLYKVRV